MLINNQNIRNRPFENEIIFQTSRSSGPGGQHVNKTETKVTLKFHIEESELLTAEEKDSILKKLRSKINKDGYLVVGSQRYRSQLKNKETALKKLYNILEKACEKKSERIPTKPSKSSVEKRIDIKKNVSRTKELRKKIKPEDID